MTKNSSVRIQKVPPRLCGSEANAERVSCNILSDLGGDNGRVASFPHGEGRKTPLIWVGVTLLAGLGGLVFYVLYAVGVSDHAEPPRFSVEGKGPVAARDNKESVSATFTPLSGVSSTQRQASEIANSSGTAVIREERLVSKRPEPAGNVDQVGQGDMVAKTAAVSEGGRSVGRKTAAVARFANTEEESSSKRGSLANEVTAELLSRDHTKTDEERDVDIITAIVKSGTGSR